MGCLIGRIVQIGLWGQKIDEKGKKIRWETSFWRKIFSYFFVHFHKLNLKKVCSVKLSSPLPSPLPTSPTQPRPTTTPLKSSFLHTHEHIEPDYVKIDSLWVL